MGPPLTYEETAKQTKTEKTEIASVGRNRDIEKIKFLILVVRYVLPRELLQFRFKTSTWYAMWRKFFKFQEWLKIRKRYAEQGE